MLRVLLVASAVSLVLSVVMASDDERATSWIEGFAIFVAVAVCASVGAGNDY